MADFIVSLLTGLSSASAMFLVASGLSIIFGVTRIVNFAHGSFYMLGAYIGYTLVQTIGSTGIGFWAAVLIAAVAVGVIGVVMEILLLRRIYKAPELFQLIATFGVILVIQDVTLWVWGSEDLVGPQAPGLKGAANILGKPIPEYDLALIAISPLVLIGLWALFKLTRWGTLVRAATQDRQMVAALGVNQRWLFTGVLFLGSALAGLGGAVQIPKGGADLLMDFNILAVAFVVVVVGGMGSIFGAFWAAVLFGVLQTFGIQILPNSTLVLMFLVMAVVLIFRPWGLLGMPETLGQAPPGPPEQPLRPALPRVRALGGAATAVLLVLPIVHIVFPEAVGTFTLVLVIEIMVFVLFAAALHFIMGPGRHGQLRPRRIFRWRCLCGRAPGEVRGRTVRARVLGRAGRRGAACISVRLVLRASERCLLCDVDARLRADRMGVRVPGHAGQRAQDLWDRRRVRHAAQDNRR